MELTNKFSKTLLGAGLALALGFAIASGNPALAEETVDSQARAEAAEAQQGVSSVVDDLVALEARIAALEGVALEARVAALEALLTPPTDVTVICPDESIQDAVDQATPGTLLTVTVEGTCTEDVMIRSNDITIQGASEGAPPSDEVVGTFTVTGAQRVTIKDLIVRNNTDGEPAEYPTGVFVTRNAAAILKNLVISGYGNGGSGIWISKNAFVEIIGVDVNSPEDGSDAFGLSDNGVARVRDSRFVNANPDPDDGHAIALFRASQIRLDGDNIITSVSDAILVAQSSEFQIRNSGATDLITGNVLFVIRGSGQLNNVEIVGNLKVSLDATVVLGGPVTIDGDVTISNRSFLAVVGQFEIS